MLSEHRLSPLSIRNLATIDIKDNEPGLIAFAESLGVGISFFSSHELNAVPNIVGSEQVFAATGAQGVCEPAALLSAGAEKLLVRKVKCTDITLAIAEVA